MLRAEVAGGHAKRAQGNARGAPRHSLRGGDAGARGGGARSPAGVDDGRRRAPWRHADGPGRHRRRGGDLPQPARRCRHDDARVQDQLLRGREVGHGPRGSHTAPSRAAHAGVADARDGRERQAPVADDPDPDGVDAVAQRQRGRGALPSRNSAQPAASARTAKANDGVYEPVTSCTNPASAGPSPAPLRQPRPTTLMIVASAASPNTSETAFTNVLSAPDAPRPKTSSAAMTVHVGSPIRSAQSAASWISRQTRIVGTAPKRSAAAPARSRPETAPMPKAESASDASSSDRPRSRAYDTLCTVTIMKTRPRKHHAVTKNQSRASAKASRRAAPPASATMRRGSVERG